MELTGSSLRSEIEDNQVCLGKRTTNRKRPPTLLISKAEFAAGPFHARVSAFSLMKRLRERNAAGLSKSKTVRNAASGDANQG